VASRRASDIALGNVVGGGGTTGVLRIPSTAASPPPRAHPTGRLAYIILLFLLLLRCYRVLSLRLPSRDRPHTEEVPAV
jgi:hypothetical protein